MPFLTYDPLPQCLQHSSATRFLLALDHDRGCTRYLLEVKCLDHGTAALAQAHRADLLRHVPGADLAAVGGAAEHPAVEAVDPVEPLLLHVPQGAFAQRRLDVDQDLDAHSCLPHPLTRGSGTPPPARPGPANRAPPPR